MKNAEQTANHRKITLENPGDNAQWADDHAPTLQLTITRSP